ncbi:hypothetical protein [Wolbachia endosymbiont (group A) of Epagoge grotiana]|uniref:hypothetical protein n=1 Tax=Wolbachia endosymbiont (group A) of Epagoge grotiana TaxID=2954006 RepID=UPI002231A399|nr:hypothetical protein [Wolbachia endosymbiont (group A) of Epagoge grotiana]
MTIEEFIKFLERKKLKDVLYKKLEWQSDHIPSNYVEVGKLFDEFGKQKIAFYLSGDVSYYASRRRTITWQAGALIFSFWLGSLVLCIQPNGQKKLLALSGWAVLSAISWYAGYSWWPGLLDLCFANRIKEYVEVYSEKVMLSHPRNEGYSGYVESIRGLVDVSEFEMHVTYLHGISSEAFKEYKEHLLATTLVNHKETRKRFLKYVEALRSGEITNDEFEVHVSRLREYSSIKINKEERYRYSTLFDETRKFFWKVVPSYCENRAISENESIENLYRILSGIDYEKATLGEVLKSLGLLELVGDYNIELVYVLKKMLFQYHPDRNKHEKAKEIFTLINENIHNPIFIILDDFEKYTNCSYTSCQLDEFLTWRIGKIKEIREEEERNLHHILEDRGKKALAVYKHLFSKVGPEGANFGYSIWDERFFKCERSPGTFKMENYRSEKAGILNGKDEILVEYRELAREYIVLGQKKLLHREKKKQLEDIEENHRRIKEEEIEDLDNEIENDERGIKEREKCLKEKKERMKSLVEYFVPLYDPMIERYEEEISYLKDVCAGKVDFAKKWKVLHEWDEEEIDRCKRKIKQEKLNTFVDERRLRLYQKRLVELKEEKEVMETLLIYLSKETAKPVSYKELAEHYCIKGEDKLVSGVVKLGTKLCLVLDYNTGNQKGLAGEYISVCHEYEHLKSEYKSTKQREDIENLNVQYEDLKNRFKTEEEKYEESQKNKKKVDKKELLVVIKERKKAEIKAQDAEAKVQDAEAKNEAYERLLLQLKNGDLPLSALQDMDIESLVAGPSWRK